MPAASSVEKRHIDLPAPARYSLTLRSLTLANGGHVTRFLHALPIIAATLFSAGSAIAETEVGRQIVNETLTSASPDSVASTRWNCMEGTEP